MPLLTVDSWNSLFAPEGKAALVTVLPDYLAARRWFGAKARRIQAVDILDVLPLPDAVSHLLLLNVEYTEGLPDRYQLPLTLALGDRGRAVLAEAGRAVFLRLRGPAAEDGVLYDAVADKGFGLMLLRLIETRHTGWGAEGVLAASQTSAFPRLRGSMARDMEPALQKAEQSNSSIVYGDSLILKLFRRLEPGVNPDVEIGCFLTEVAGFPHVPPAAGSLEYRDRGGRTMTLAFLQGFVPNRGDAWGYTLEELRGYFERTRARAGPPEARKPLLAAAQEDLPGLARETIGPYLDSARLLGRRTAEMHLALADDHGRPDFTPEPLTEAYRRALSDRVVRQVTESLALLRQRLAHIPEDARRDAVTAIELEPRMHGRCRAVAERPIEAARIRHHGDYHLGQVLWTGEDFLIIDFEGEPARPLSERRMKRPSLRDVAGMLRSFHYGSQMALFGQAHGGRALDDWAAFWNSQVSAAFLREYLAAAGPAVFLPKTAGELEVLLQAYLLEKACYELAYELNNRPDWVRIPLRGILELMETA